MSDWLRGHGDDIPATKIAMLNILEIRDAKQNPENWNLLLNSIFFILVEEIT